MNNVLTADDTPASRSRIKAVGYAAKHCFSHLKPFEFEREAAGEQEVEIRVLYCGVCHSDIHQVRNECGTTPSIHACRATKSSVASRGSAVLSLATRSAIWSESAA